MPRRPVYAQRVGRHLEDGRLLLPIVFSIVLNSAFAQSSNMNCVVALRLPSTTPFSALARRGGTIDSTVSLDAEGSIKEVKLSGSNDPGLRAEVESFLRLSKFSPNCEHRPVHVRFTYVLDAERVEERMPPLITFKPPDHFVIVVRPVKPMASQPPPG